jgi:ribosome-associated protein
MPFNKRSIGVEAVLKAVSQSLDDDKAVDVVTIDLNGKSTIADYMVIASGRSHRQVGAMTDHLLSALKDAGLGRVGVEGQAQADWVLVDAGDVIVHLFRPEIRSFYNLEKMWGMDMPDQGKVGALG